MPEEERLQTLQDLLASKKLTNNLLERLPVSIRSLKMAEHKRELEDKMNKLDRAIETFSKQKVFVQL
jgi:NAD(P)H-nitrite reductase large subunit